jgi:AMP deaminase
LAHRRGSETHSEVPSLLGTFRLSSINAATPAVDAPVFDEKEEDEQTAQEPGTYHSLLRSTKKNSMLFLYLEIVSSELEGLFRSFQKCLDLRDKYMRRSCQRLGDNPRDHDGRFPGLDDERADVSGARPDADYTLNAPPPSPFQPWKIYPRPPPPHWHWRGKDSVVVYPDGTRNVDAEEEFMFETCSIPESHPWGFEIDDTGVYQVYKDVGCADKKPLFDVPTLREYFSDFNSILGVISDGPTKSFAYKRLKYLAGKFTLYSLLNDSQELADMKVRVVLNGNHGF